MDSIKVTYKLERYDSAYSHGWIIWMCYPGVEEEYFFSSCYEEAYAIYKDLHPEVL